MLRPSLQHHSNPQPCLLLGACKQLIGDAAETRYAVAITTVWSVLGYLISRDAVKILSAKETRKRIGQAEENGESLRFYAETGPVDGTYRGDLLLRPHYADPLAIIFQSPIVRTL